MREAGFYWVRYERDSRWEIVEFVHDYDGVWVVGSDRTLSGLLHGDAMYEIDERRIERSEVLSE